MSDQAGKLIMTLDLDADSPGSPMHMVAEARLEHYRRMEAEALYLRKVLQAIRLAIVDVPAFDILDACTAQSHACAAAASADQTTISRQTRESSDTSQS